MQLQLDQGLSIFNPPKADRHSRENGNPPLGTLPPRRTAFAGVKNPTAADQQYRGTEKPWQPDKTTPAGYQSAATGDFTWFLNAGMTSLPNHSNCSRVTLSGVPIFAHCTFTS